MNRRNELLYADRRPRIAPNRALITSETYALMLVNTRSAAEGARMPVLAHLSSDLDAVKHSVFVIPK